MAGWFVRRTRRWVGYLLFGGGILVLGTTVPGLAMSKTAIDANHFEWWRAFKHTNVRLDELREVVHSVKQVSVGDTTQDIHYFDFVKKDGQVLHPARLTQNFRQAREKIILHRSRPIPSVPSVEISRRSLPAIEVGYVMAPIGCTG